METIILNQPDIFENIWKTINPYWFIFLNGFASGLGSGIALLFIGGKILTILKKILKVEEKK